MKRKMKKSWMFAVVAAGCFVFASCEDETGVVDETPEGIPVLDDSAPSAAIPSEGFYVANEDWMGHDEGTVNYFKAKGSDYEPVYRAYRAANPNETFGTTTQFATIWGENAYFLSKQDNCLVVADARTLKKKAVFEDLGGGGRSFVGVDDQLGYIGHSKGIRQFNLVTLQLGEPVEGVSDQMGSLCYAAGRVFAVAQNNVYIINVSTNQVEKTLNGSFSTLTRSKDGTVWVAASDKFIRINPQTLTQEEMAYPGNVAVGNSWGAWNAGSLCASTQKNVLYWTKATGWNSTGIVKYDIDKQEFNGSFYSLSTHEGQQQVFYGAGLRVDPLTDKVVATYTRDGYGANFSYNWVALIAPNGTLEKEIVLGGDNGTGGASGSKGDNYFWFPAIPFFEDANLPEILINQIRLAPGETKTIDLNQKMVDADNLSVAILCEAEMAANELVTSKLENGVLTVTAKEKSGSTECQVTAISNGKRVEKKVRVDVVVD